MCLSQSQWKLTFHWAWAHQISHIRVDPPGTPSIYGHTRIVSRQNSSQSDYACFADAVGLLWPAICPFGSILGAFLVLLLQSFEALKAHLGASKASLDLFAVLIQRRPNRGYVDDSSSFLNKGMKALHICDQQHQNASSSQSHELSTHMQSPSNICIQGRLKMSWGIIVIKVYICVVDQDIKSLVILPNSFCQVLNVCRVRNVEHWVPNLGF